MKRTILPIVFFFLFAAAATAQSFPLKGKVTANAQPAEAATVALLRSKDSGLVKLGLTGKDGLFEMYVDSGSYLIKITGVGFDEKLGGPYIVAAATEPPEFQLTLATKALGGVTVQSKKPLVEAKLDKMVVNVDASPTNAGATAMEVLEKSPGVSVDRDGNISLKGKQGVVVMMDGKPTYLSSTELANLLRSLPASQIDQVEIMTQPSAKFDAAGNSGVINIRTKKSRQTGFNGGINVSYVQGKYPKSPNSANFNFRKNKVNIFANAGYTYWENYSIQTLTRRFRGATTTNVFDQVGRSNNVSSSYNARVGLDYSLNNTTTIGFTVNGTVAKRRAVNTSLGDFFKEGSTSVDSSISALNRTKNPWDNVSANFNFRKQLDKAGRELTADVDVIRYTATLNQYTDNRVTNPNTPSTPYLLRGILPSAIDIYSGKLDYAHPLKGGAKFEAGLKASLVKTDNNAPYETFDGTQDKWVDDVRKDHFAYDEQISAAYLNFSKQQGKWGIQAGLRGEYTASTGKQVLKAKEIKRDYFQLFPTAYVSYSMNDKNQFGLSYGRRIDRPNYQDLNPFQRFLDLYTYNQGNPFLTPQFTHNVELSHIFGGKLSTTLNYTYTTDIINDILKQNDETKVTFQTRENVARRRNIGLAVSYNAPITKWWTTSIYGNVFNNYYKGLVNNAMLSTDATTFAINMNQQFRFAGTWGAEISGFYQGKALETSMFIIDPMYQLSFGASKQIMKKKATLKLSVIDPFEFQKVNVKVVHDNIDMFVTNRWDNRRVSLTFSWRFSKGQSVQQRKGSGSAQDEQRRIGQGN